MRLSQKLASTNAGFWFFISLAFFGSMIWAKSRDPFERIWFTVKTPHYGKVKGVAVLPVHSNAKTQRGKGAEKNGMVASPPLRDSALNFPVVFYVYGSGGSLINSGNELRQLAELGMAAIAIEYNQTNQAAFEEQFVAAHEWINGEFFKRGTGNSERGKGNQEAWLGFSLGAERTLGLFLKAVGESPTAAGGTPALPLPQVYVRLAGGGMPLEEFKTQNLKPKTHLLVVHGEHDEIFPVVEAKQVAEFFQTNGISTELRIHPGKGHGFDADRAQVFRGIGEYIKAQLTPEHPLPEFPVTKNYPFVLCIAPAFLWAGFWIYLRRGRTGNSPVVAGDPPATSQNIEHPTSNAEHRKLKKWEIGLRVTAIILATLALAQTGIHLITPRLAVSDTTIRIARKWLLAPKWNEDFETLAAKPFWRGQRLKTLLTHVELSNYCVYELINWKVDQSIYNEYVLSPVIETKAIDEPPMGAGETPALPEMNWRRPLWEFFYPRIRKEDSPEAAAEIVVRTLRERVTIVSAEFNLTARLKGLSADRMSAARSGIESIWRNQITDEKGFQRIYVATLRSVGVGARLTDDGITEFWTDLEWKPAPQPFIR